MIKEKAIMNGENRRIETPETNERIKTPLDLEIGDLVQIRADGLPDAGGIGEIIGVRLAPGSSRFKYTVKLSDSRSVEAPANRLVFLRRERN